MKFKKSKDRLDNNEDPSCLEGSTKHIKWGPNGLELRGLQISSDKIRNVNIQLSYSCNDDGWPVIHLELRFGSDRLRFYTPASTYEEIQDICFMPLEGGVEISSCDLFRLLSYLRLSGASDTHKPNMDVELTSEFFLENSFPEVPVDEQKWFYRTVLELSSSKNQINLTINFVEKCLQFVSKRNSENFFKKLYSYFKKINPNYRFLIENYFISFIEDFDWPLLLVTDLDLDYEAKGLNKKVKKKLKSPYLDNLESTGLTFSSKMKTIRKSDINFLVNIGFFQKLKRVAFFGISDPSKCNEILNLNHVTDLRSVYFENCCMIWCGVRRFINHPNMSNLNNLIFSSCDLNDSDLKEIANSPYLRNLLRLDLTYNNSIIGKNIPNILNSPRLGSLKLLYLGHNGIDDSAVPKIADSPGLSKLDSLDLRSNYIEERGKSHLENSPYLREGVLKI